MRKLIALVPMLLLAAAACTDPPQGGSTPGREPVVAARQTGTTLKPRIGPPPLELIETTARIRFVNAWAHDGDLASIDVYWGTNTDTGVKFLSLAPGEVSEEVPVQIVAGTSLATHAVRFIVQPAGDMDRSHSLQAASESWTEGERRIYVVGTPSPSASPSSTAYGANGAWIHVEGGKTPGIGAAPEGTALVFVSNVGLSHLRKEDAVIVGTADGGCLARDGSGTSTGTLGTPFVLAPGPQVLTVYAPDCSVPVGPNIELDVAEGDRYVLVAQGATADSRRAVAVKI